MRRFLLAVLMLRLFWRPCPGCDVIVGVVVGYTAAGAPIVLVERGWSEAFVVLNHHEKIISDAWVEIERTT